MARPTKAAAAKKAEETPQGIANMQEKREEMKEKEAQHPTEEQPIPKEAEPVVSKRLKDFVYAKRGDERNMFSQLEWNNLGADKGGWQIDVEEPAEVAALKARQAEQE